MIIVSELTSKKRRSRRYPFDWLLLGRSTPVSVSPRPDYANRACAGYIPTIETPEIIFMSIAVVDNSDGPPLSFPYPKLSNQTPSVCTRPQLLLMRSYSLPLPPQSSLPSQAQQPNTIHEPGSPHWRRERLLRIGSANRSSNEPTSPELLNEPASPTVEQTETAALMPTRNRSRTYGTVSSYRNYRNRVLSRESGFRYNSTPASLSRSSSMGLLRRASAFRRPTDYDDPAVNSDGPAKDSAEKPGANGIRVW